MKKTAGVSLLFWIALTLTVGTAFAGEARQIELTDGSVIAAEVLSVSGGVYTLRSESMGTFKVKESKIRAIRFTDAGAGPRVPNRATGQAPQANDQFMGQVDALQQSIMGNDAMMGMIQGLQNDPEIKRIVSDPELIRAVQSGDIGALLANPKFMELMNNQKLRSVQRQIAPTP